MALDERLRREIERVAEPADPSGVYERLIRRKERRHIVHRVELGILSLLVVAGTAAGIVGLSKVFGDGGSVSPLPSAQPGPKRNGLVAITTGDAIRVQDVDGSNGRTIRSPATGLAWHIAWSPDGRRLAVAIFGDPGRSLWVMRADGRDPVRIAEGDNVSRPSWHPDGFHLVYSLTDEGVTEIHITRSDGTDDRIVYSEAAPGTYAVFSASFSPDGSEILFDAGTDTGYDIFVMDADGSGVEQITRTGTDYNPSWSPDGRSIVFTREEDPGESDIFLMRADGSEVHRLTDSGPRVTNLDPQYSPDGRWITYEAAENGGVGPVVIMNAEGGDARVLIDSDVLGFSWQPLSVANATGPTGQRLDEGRDIGLGLRLCDVTTVRGRFSDEDGEVQTAIVGTQPTAEGCPPVGQVTGVAALDLTGDGGADVASEPFGCEGGCLAYAAPDVDGDGTDELLVQDVFFTIVGLRLFDLDAGGSALVTPMVEPPGDPTLASQGFDGSGPPQFWIGGDAFVADALRCEDRPEGRVLISTTAESLPHDSPDAVWQIHETTFELRDGVLRVLETRDLEEPAGPGTRPSFMSTGGCGADLRPGS